MTVEQPVGKGGRTGHWVLLAIALGAVVGIGWIDVISGPRISLSLLYLVPIVVCGWWLGSGHATVAALLASACWLVADMLWHDEGFPTISIWNGVTRVAIFVSTGLVTARLLKDRERLKALNLKLIELAGREATLARTDPLTGLSNSRAFYESLRTEIERSRRDGHPLCVAYLDLDNFKVVNDTLGHLAGDSLLKKVATVIKKTLRQTDVAARVGGDEFAIILWNVQIEHAQATANRLVEGIAHLARETDGVDFGASIGVAHLTEPTADVERLIQLADQAMLDAKSAGKGQVVVHACGAIAQGA